MKPLSKLTQLHLNDNQITTIESKAFIGITAVEIISLQNNQLTFDSEGDTLIDGVPLKLSVGSPFQRLEKLQHLNLARNEIRNLLEDYTLVSLRNLNLSHNQITMLSTDDLQSLSRDGLTIDLTHNRIEDINFRPIIDGTMSAVSVLLNDNPLNCDCHILHFIRHIRNVTGTQSNIEVTVGDLKCAQPEIMMNKLVADLTPMELLCPLDNEETTKKLCPGECTCNVRPEDKYLILECDAAVDFYQLPIASELSLSHTELKIENSNLTDLPIASRSPGYKQISKLILNNNSLTKVTAENLPSNLAVLELRDNKLTTLHKDLMESFSNSSFNLSLAGNPWKCDCLNKDFFTAALKLNSVLKNFDFSKMVCDEDAKRSFDLFKPEELCSSQFTMIVSIITAFMGLLLGGLAALYYKYQKQIKMWLYSHNMCLWFVSEEELDKVCSFHN